CKLDWKMALCQLQLGGERGYGWGGLIPVFPKNQKEFKPLETNKLFCGEATFEATEDRPIIKPTERLLAHTVPANVSVQGEIEPLVGREWTESSGAGEHVAFSSMCWIPGSRVEKVPAFQIGNFGIWQVV
ncbi:MAG: hypothetical protein N2235_26510, partial [Fischerella sp.]|nr:hypothetical protein [Fischerella sp.]